MKTYKISISILFIIITQSMCFIEKVYSQTEREIKIELNKLREYSIHYHMYNHALVGDTTGKYVATKKYQDQIDKIKSGPNKDLYIQFLNKATTTDSLLYKEKYGYNYTFINPLITYNSRTKPTLLEYYKVVKYSLFTLNRNELVAMSEAYFLRYKEIRIGPVQ